MAVVPGGQRADDAHPEHERLRQEDRLAEHRRLGLDAARPPAEHAEAVDHRRVRVGPHERVGERDRRRGLATTRAEVLEVHLVADARARRDDAERCRRPAAPTGAARSARALRAVLPVDVGLVRVRATGTDRPARSGR